MGSLSLLVVFATVLLANVCNAAAPNFPAKPLRIVVPFTAGSGADANPRFYGELLSRLWGQSIVVDNRPGGSGIIAVQAVKSAAADGYTLLTGTTSLMTVNPVVMKDLPYDPLRDFVPVVLFGLTPSAFIVSTSSPARTVRDLIEMAKKTGSPLSMGTYSVGYELVSAWLGIASGITVTPVPYKGGAPMMTDVIGNQIASGVIDPGGALPLIQEGRLRALAITADKRLAVLPEVPTMKESGFPDFISNTFSSIFVRSETPDAIVKKLREGFKTVMESPAGRAYQAGKPTVIVDYSPQEIRAFLVSEHDRYRKIALAVGVKPR